jgi:hypothetical protein
MSLERGERRRSPGVIARRDQFSDRSTVRRYGDPLAVAGRQQQLGERPIGLRRGHREIGL